jgi:hypothetical protein
MTSACTPHVHEATLRLEDEADPAAVGAAVTVELCGAWEHEGGCRWPHNNKIWPEEKSATFRTLFVATSSDIHEIHNRIAVALRSSGEWSVISDGPRPLGADDEALATRLARTPLPADT